MTQINKDSTTKEIMAEATRLLGIPRDETGLAEDHAYLLSRLVNALQAIGDSNIDGEAEYFYTTHHPHRWSSGASQSKYDMRGGGFSDIASLEQAKEIAESESVVSSGDDRCVTTYGVQFRVPNR